MNSDHNDGELNYVINQCLPRLSSQTVKPLTVKAIIGHITAQQHAASLLSDAERAFLADFAASEHPGSFIEDSFLRSALDGGKTLRTAIYRLGDEQNEEGGWFGIYRFLGLYVVSSTQYGERQDLFGPVAKRKDANAIFDAVRFRDSPG